MSTSADGRSKAPRGLVIAAFAAIYLIWGSTYLGIRFAVETLPPFLMGGARFLTAGLLLYVWLRASEIGRASCRGRGEISGVAGSLKKKKKKMERGGGKTKKNRETFKKKQCSVTTWRS